MYTAHWIIPNHPCSIHERAIMYKRVSKACICAACSDELQAKLSSPTGRTDGRKNKKDVFLLQKHKNGSEWVPPVTTLVTSSLTSPRVNMQMNEHDFFSAWQLFSRCGGHFVPSWFIISSGGSSFGLLERSPGTNETRARGVRQGWGVRPSCSYIYPLCKTAGTKPEYSHKQHWHKLDLTTQKWTGLV